MQAKLLAFQRVPKKIEPVCMHCMECLFTSESVSEGHPDKVADQISDAILDAYLFRDPDSRVAVETLVTTNLVVLAGEVRARDGVNESIDREEIARRVITEIGYSDPALKFCGDTVEVVDRVHGQSPNIAIGVDASAEKAQGAGDQGMMFGFACTEITEVPGVGERVLMPMPIHYAHRLVERLAHLRKHTSLMPYLRPDSKSQVTVAYDDGRPVAVDTVVLSTQHADGVAQKRIKDDIRRWLVPEVFPKGIHAQAASGQSDGHLRGRWSARRYRPDGQENHCGHVWRPWRPRWWCL